MNQPGSAPSRRRRGSSPAGRSAAAQTTSPPHVWTAPGWRHLETAPARRASAACSCAPPPSNGQRQVYSQPLLFFFSFFPKISKCTIRIKGNTVCGFSLCYCTDQSCCHCSPQSLELNPLHSLSVKTQRLTTVKQKPLISSSLSGPTKYSECLSDGIRKI